MGREPVARLRGGILATLVDVVADYALAAHLGGPAPTVDLRVDYHKAALQGDLTVKGRVVRRGGTFAARRTSTTRTAGGERPRHLRRPAEIAKEDR